MNTHKKGFILFSVLCIILVLIIIVVPLIAWSVHELSWTNRSFKALVALNLADAGAELTIWEIVHNNAQFIGWGGTNPKTLSLTSFTDNYTKVKGDIAISCNNTSPDNYLVTSYGCVPDVTTREVRKTVKVKVFPHPLFNNGIFGYDSVTVSGNAFVDSYDSSLGPYNPATAGDNGDIGSNGTLTFDENSIVNADAFIGPTGTVIGNTPTHLSGETYYTGEEVAPGEIPDISYYIILPSLGNLAVSGNQDLTILPGDYRYESITVDGQGILRISSNVRLYIHNDFIVAGQASVITNEDVEIYIAGNAAIAGQGIVNTSGTPSDLLIYGVGVDTNISFTGVSDFYGTFYAPNSSVYLAGDADYYGAIVGKSTELAGNIKFHYDENLTQTGPTIGYDIAYWQED